MNRLSDEILNKYIDGELDYETLSRVRTILKESEADRENLKVLQRVHNELKEIKEFEVNPNFTSSVMNKIAVKFKPKKADKYFIISISSFFILVCLAIIGVVIALLVNSPEQTSSSDQIFGYIVSSLENFAFFIRKIFSGSGMSIFGSIISFGILISAYFFFESHKHMKEIQDKF